MAKEIFVVQRGNEHTDKLKNKYQGASVGYFRIFKNYVKKLPEVY